MVKDIPREVKEIILKLQNNGFEAYVVGGGVRDFLRGVEPDDWDVTTNAKPEEIKRIFPKSFYENKFFTVTVQTKSKKPALKEIEITTFRSETKYTDKRHPDEVKPAKTIQEDLGRRDFTINAMALNLRKSDFQIIDPFNGRKDLENKTIMTVGKPEERFSEDALRMMRAIRFSVTLGDGWKIEEGTLKAIKANSGLLRVISKERVKYELIRIIMSDRAADGIELLRTSGLLEYIISELVKCYGVGQNKHHIYDCYTHNLLSLKYAAKQKFNYYVRIAALLHDIAKPWVKQGDGPDATFYNHEVVGARMTTQILNRLRFPKKDIEKIAKLVRYHLFYYNVGEVSESSIRRLLRNVGPENIEELLEVRMSDRIGSGVPKAEPYKLRHLKYVIEKVSKDPISVKMLKMNGNDIMELLKIKPGPKIGQILDILLGEVLEDPKKNTKMFLVKQIKKLGRLSDKELDELAKKARDERQGLEMKEDKMTKNKYWVT